MKTNPWKDLFHLFRQEQKAFIFFVVLLFIVFTIKLSIPYIVQQEQNDFRKFDRFVAIQDSLQKVNSLTQELLDTVDINAADTLVWRSLGFSTKQSRVIVNYRAKIGGFSFKEDLLDVFVVSEKTYERIEPYLVVNDFLDQPLEKSTDETSIRKWKKLPKQKRAWKKDTFTEGKRENDAYKRPVVELNSADSLELVSLYGIGPYFSMKIINYRDRLGGFYSVNQLNEVRNLSQETIDEISTDVSVDTMLIRKIDINRCSFKELLKHPYLDYYFTKKIFQYKDANGKYTSLHDLKKIEFIDSTFFVKIRPYLSVE